MDKILVINPGLSLINIRKRLKEIPFTTEVQKEEMDKIVEALDYVIEVVVG